MWDSYQISYTLLHAGIVTRLVTQGGSHKITRKLLGKFEGRFLTHGLLATTHKHDYSGNQSYATTHALAGQHSVIRWYGLS